MSSKNFSRKYPSTKGKWPERPNRFGKRSEEDGNQNAQTELAEPQFEESVESQIFEIKHQKKNFKCNAFLSNFRSVTITDEDNQEITALLMVFYSQAGDWVSCYLAASPYMLLRCAEDSENTVISFLEKRYEGKFGSMTIEEKVDLQTMNHLSGLKTKFLKCSFRKEADMNIVKSDILRRLSIRKFNASTTRRFDHHFSTENPFDLIIGIHEYDIPHTARVCIDHKLRVSFWYEINVEKGFLRTSRQLSNILEKPEFSILAFDIETTKLPLKFPDARYDSVMLISYVADKQTYLIVNREIVGGDVAEFDYEPKPEFAQRVNVFNEPNEKAALQRFFEHIRMIKPLVITSYNGDMFDIPFIASRAKTNGLDMETDIGLVIGRSGDMYTGRFIFCHLDCYYWVKRDAFLPQGSHGLKAVTKAKLGYTPIECDPEKMMDMARHAPQRLAEYSVSDAVATYFLYTKHIHDFIFALCTIVPMTPDDVLRRGSGTLCENLLMAQAYENKIVFPNKKTDSQDKYYKGYLIESETYVGGFVECLNNGAYRADLPQDFKLDPERYNQLIGGVRDVIAFYLKRESTEGLTLDDIQNLREVEEQITSSLCQLRDEAVAAPQQVVSKRPLIYHVDVASMYPNIILTNRLQPTAIVNDQICSNCLYNEKRNNCKRPLTWEWRVTHYPVKKLEYEKLASTTDKDNLKSTLKLYCQRNYKSVHKTVVEPRENTVCMRENSFYVDTIRDFRDRRYDYKTRAKLMGIEEKEHAKKGNFEKANECANLAVLFDSLQLAHKIILNSFYGYVMKKGARWYSMKMAAMVTNTGKWIIQEARGLFEKVGKPLELDTDGIWTMLPQGFPEKLELLTTGGKRLRFNYICSLINHLIYDKFKNTQYQELKEDGSYAIREEMQIFFEIDGPYRAMIIPASKEENKKLKKRYVVFNFEGKITEIKGFEIKRRGELGIVKVFQSEIFGRFLEGASLKELYGACAQTAKKWVAIIKSRAERLSEAEVIELLGEMKVLSKSVEEYGIQKGIALTAAKRLAQINGEEILKGSGLNCEFVISKGPEGAPLNERAVPVAVFHLPDERRRKFLRTWLKTTDEADLSLKGVLDWDYYLDRLNSTIQKIIVIPAILQGLENPIPELGCPDWLRKRVNEKSGKQNTLNFAVGPKKPAAIPLPGAAEQVTPKTASKMAVLDTKVAQESPAISPAQMQEPEPENLLPEHLTAMAQKWSQRKVFWLQARVRKQASILPQDLLSKGTNIIDFVHTGNVSHSKAQWHVYKIDPSQGDGVLRFWYIAGGVVQATQRVEVNRFFYINSFVEETSEKGNFRLSKKQLPHDKPNPFLYEFEVPEFAFQTDYWRFTYFIADPSKEGIYETNLPLDFKAVMAAGVLCKTDSNVPASRGVLPMEAIKQEIKGSAPTFFGRSIFEPRRFVVYVWTMSYKQRLFTFIFSRSFVKVLRLTKDGRSEAITQNIFALLKDHFQTFSSQPEIQSVIEGIELNRDDIINCKDRAVYAQKLGAIKTEIDAYSKKVPVLVVLSSKSISAAKDISNTWNDSPVLEFRLSKLERNKIDDLLPEKLFIEKSFEDLTALDAQLLKLDRLSAYARVPLCNMAATYDKALIRCTDVMFGRELQRANAILWYSNDRRPDLGVKGYNHYELEDYLAQQQHICLFSEPSFCQTYVVEVNVHKFFNAALAVMDQFYQLDREVKTAQPNRQFTMEAAHTTYSTYNKTGLKAVRNLYKTWLDDLEPNGYSAAEDLLEKLVPWVCSEDSHFHDPVMETAVMRVSKLLFKELLVKLEGLGTKVVFANPYKIFVDTKKTTFASALNSINFVLETVLKDQLFSHMYFNLGEFYKTLLFYDLQNFIGVFHDFEGQNPQMADPENLKIGLFSEWNLQQFLPAPAQPLFHDMVTEYFQLWFQLLSTHSYGKALDQKQMRLASEAVNAGVQNYLESKFSLDLFNCLTYLQEQQRDFEFRKYEQTHKKGSQFGSSLKIEKIRKKNSISVEASDRSYDEYEDENDLYDDSFIENDDEEAREIEKEMQFIRKRKEKVGDDDIKADIRITPSKRKEIDDAAQQSWQLVNLIGGSQRTEILPLEFLNLIIEVLSITSEELKLVVDGLKVGGLKFLKLEETIEKARFQKVFIDCNLVNLNCGNEGCNVLMTLNVFESYSPESKGWNCYCGKRYPNTLIESRLIDHINTCYKLYVLQPEKCVRCKKLRTNKFSNDCPCHGKYKRECEQVIRDFEEELQNKLANYKALAISAEMKLLEDCLRDFSE